MTRVKVCLFILLTIFISCEEVLFDPEPSNTPEDNFEILWHDYDQFYSFFELKKLNWDSVYSANRPLVKPTTTPKQLYDIFRGMLLYLKDGHADLCLNNYNFGCIRHDLVAGHHVNRLGHLNAYLTLQTNSKAVRSGIIQNDVGYIHISSFGEGIEDYSVIDDILVHFAESGVKGIIIDIRGNGGGSDSFSRLIANRFTSQELVYSYFRYKDGPAHNSFGPWKEKRIYPEGEYYDGPVMVLTNRQVASAAEDFTLAMKSISQTTVIGDTTGGALGNPVVRVLPNNWFYRIPRWIQVDSKMNSPEGIGIFPDIPVWISRADSLAGHDTILERALEELRK